ncbi:hypothetical protein C4573_07290 [Candidatus Woesearchaeota archaeon]|nr:MAG: hypothetical protein C4573_07290 [Candidatus Woesearchaeota archaeon]
MDPKFAEFLQSEEYFSKMSLERRLMSDKNADPVLIIQGLDKLAEINFRALQQTVDIANLIQQTLLNGSIYPQGKDIPALYADFKQTVTDMIDHVWYLGTGFSDDSNPEAQKACLIALDSKLKPSLDTLHRLFTSKYHQPSPIPESLRKETNILASLDRFSGTFKEPVQTAMHILTGGSKPEVELKTVETYEELIRILHDQGIERVQHLMWNILHHDYYNHLKKVELSSRTYGSPEIQGIGSNDPEAFKKAKIWQVAQSLIDYMYLDKTAQVSFRGDKANWNAKLGMGFLMTPTTLTGVIAIPYDYVGDKANCHVMIHYDANQEEYHFKFSCGNKGYFGSEFMKHTKKEFTRQGYQYSDTGWENKAFFLEKRSSELDICAILEVIKESLRSRY